MPKPKVEGQKWVKVGSLRRKVEGKMDEDQKKEARKRKHRGHNREGSINDLGVSPPKGLLHPKKSRRVA